ncbi:adenylyl-sulfate kinase [Limnochorda pilosa]|uniref:Adenylyl-sulfate kinase n=1 Tax=Limnochorda pilosa TaxID=1555112 RepID=A0A0K2SM50_LIMPI|nr:adenylyl-sulfate kinase [Limnochorda pilosa]BAS28097.1 adenylylsulfate kinase [Limnochorda pilosa]
MQRGVTVWFTGLSGAGKTTVAKWVEAILKERGALVERLDGDVVRQSLTRDLGFSKEDRDKNIEGVTFVTKLLTRNGVVCLSSFISPYRVVREASRREIGEFLEVFVTAPMKTLLERDVKGLYKKAMAGEIQNFTGVNDPYELPENPDPVLHTDRGSVEACAGQVIRLLERRGYLEAAGDGPAVEAGIVSLLAAGRDGVPEAASATLATGDGHAPGGDGGRHPTLGPIEPHGGTEARERAIARAQALVQVELDERELADLEMIGIGALSPLNGSMRKLDYELVVESMRLADGLLWPLPVTLAVTQEQADQIAEGQVYTVPAHERIPS